MDKLNLMTSFVHVAETGSYTEAAKKLARTKALMSTHISQLETLLEVRLINRSTRGVQLTEVGKAYYEHAKRLLDDIASVEARLKNDNQSLAGRLRLTAPTTFGECTLMPFLAEFRASHPKLDIDLVLTDRYLDIVSEGFDLAIRIGALDDSGLIARHVGNITMHLCASPMFIEQFGMPHQPSDLSQLPAIFDTNFKRPGGWQCFKNAQSYPLRVKHKVSVNSAIASAKLAKDSALLVLGPDFALQDYLVSGQLVPLLEEYDMGVSPVNVVYTHRQHLSPKVTTLVESLKAFLAQTEKESDRQDDRP